MRRLSMIPALAATLALVSTGCSVVKDKPSTNVQPPKAGVPASGDEVTGIYRTIHQGLLQLRSGGSFVLIVPEGPGPSAGNYTLRDGRLEVRTKACGDETGAYDVVITGAQEAGKATLNISAVEDSCEARSHYLTVDPWVYANS